MMGLPLFGNEGSDTPVPSESSNLLLTCSPCLTLFLAVHKINIQ